MKEENKTLFSDKEEKKDELEGIGGMFYGMGWRDALLILGVLFSPILFRLLVGFI